MGDESLDVDEVGIGLDGAENMGQDGERGEVGLGFGGAARQNNQKTCQHTGKPQWEHEVHGRPNDGELEQTRSTKIQAVSSMPNHISPDQTLVSSK